MLKKVLGLLAIAGLFIVLAFGFKFNPREIPSPLVGKKSPVFTIPTFEGGAFSLEEQRGKPVIVNFWASWCVACVEEEEALEAVYQKYKNKGVVFVGVNIQDKREDALAYMQQHPKTYIVARDETGDVSVDYGLYGVPETFFVNQNGTIAYKHVGPLTEGALIAYIEKMLRGEG